MKELTPAALRWLADHHGVITTSALRSSEVGRSTVDRLVRAGVLRIAGKGVYVLTATRSTLEQRCVVLSAVHPTGYVTGPTAGVLYDLRRMPPASALHFGCRHGDHLPTEPGVRFRQTRALTASDRRIRPDGIIVARPRRLAFDLATDLPPLDHVSVLQQLLDRRLVTFEELVQVGDRLCHPARPGSTRFEESLHRLDRGAPAQSHPEVILAEALWAALHTRRAAGSGDPSGREPCPHRPRRAGHQVGHRARHPPGAPQHRGPRWRRPPVSQPAPRGVAGRAGERGTTWRTWPNSPTSWRSCITPGDVSSSVIGVFPEGRVRSRHSNDSKHSNRG